MASNQICRTARNCWKCCLFFLLYRLPNGSRHAPLKEISIHLTMIPEDAYKYIVRGKWHARLPAPVPGSPLQRRLPCSGYRVYGPFFLQESRSRLNGESGSGIRPRAFVYVRLAPRKTPFLLLIVSPGLVEMVENATRKMLRGILCEYVRICMTSRLLKIYSRIIYLFMYYSRDVTI